MLKRDKGFSLLEIIAVIAIIGIVSAIAIPNLISFRSGMRMRSASRDLVSNFKKAQTNAIRKSAGRSYPPTPTCTPMPLPTTTPTPSNCDYCNNLCGSFPITTPDGLTITYPNKSLCNSLWAIQFTQIGYQIVSCGCGATNCQAISASDDIMDTVIYSQAYPGIAPFESYTDRVIFYPNGTFGNPSTFSKNYSFVPTTVKPTDIIPVVSVIGTGISKIQYKPYNSLP